MRFSHPHTIKLWYPHTVAYEAATYGVTIKAPERGDTSTPGRNQLHVRTRAGNNVVYDLGNDLTPELSMAFREVPEVERSALIVFLDAVQWGSSLLKYQDYRGTQYTVRCKNNGIRFTTVDEVVRGDYTTTIYDFDLTLMDVTNNIYETGDTLVPTQLAIHIADLNHPHNPLVTSTVNIADGAKVLESLSVDSFKTVIWVASCTKTTQSITQVITVTHNGTSGADATTTDMQREESAQIGYANELTFSVDLTGAGTAQTIRLKCATTVDGWSVAIRRVKL